jgi:hypothetical protein
LLRFIVSTVVGFGVGETLYTHEFAHWETNATEIIITTKTQILTRFARGKFSGQVIWINLVGGYFS